MEITVVLPIPPRELRHGVHAKIGTGQAKARATKHYKTRACNLAIAAMCAMGFDLDNRPRWELARIHYRFYWPNKSGAMDYVNAMQSAKPGIDGLVKAGLIMDDGWRILRPPTIEYRFCKVNPRLELVVWDGSREEDVTPNQVERASLCICDEIREGLAWPTREVAETEKERAGHYAGCPLHPDMQTS